MALVILVAIAITMLGAWRIIRLANTPLPPPAPPAPATDRICAIPAEPSAVVRSRGRRGRPPRVRASEPSPAPPVVGDGDGLKPAREEPGLFEADHEIWFKGCPGLVPDTGLASLDPFTGREDDPFEQDEIDLVLRHYLPPPPIWSAGPKRRYPRSRQPRLAILSAREPGPVVHRVRPGADL